MGTVASGELPSAAEDLPTLFWRRVDETLRERGLARRWLKGAVRRNKNTLTKWFSNNPPNPTLSDVADIAKALSVGPGELLSTAGSEVAQLSLPFPKTGVSAQLDIQWTGSSVVIKRKPPASEGSFVPPSMSGEVDL